MFLSNTYKYKISVKTQQFYCITTTPGLHISAPSSHHQALLDLFIGGPDDDLRELKHVALA